MDSFTCASCSKEFPIAEGVPLSIPAQVAFFVVTLGGLVAGRLCRECHSGITAIGVIGLLIGSVVLMAVGAKWLGS